MVWKISNKVEKNWASFVITHIVDNKTKDMWLPYGGMITKILEHIGFNLKGDESHHVYIGIVSGMLNQMGINIKDGDLLDLLVNQLLLSKERHLYWN